MKYLLIIAALFFMLPASAQLKIENGNMYWQRVIECPGTTSEIRDRINKSGVFTTISLNDSTAVIGRVERVILRYTTMDQTPTMFNKPIPFRDGEQFSGVLIYEIKEGRYRVTFKDIIYNSNMTVKWASVSYDAGHMTLNDIMLDGDGEFIRGKIALQFAETIFDYSFSNSFVIKNTPAAVDNDW